MKEITSEKWGPFQGSHVGLSYGSGTHYLILRDATGSRPQGAVVPPRGNFLAGVMRCSKCKSNRIAINQKQSRAADEGMTLYCLCECGHAWKM